MKIMFNGKEIANVTTNRSMTLEDTVYVGLGIDINNQEDCEKAYNDGADYAYLDDCGNYCIDVENMELVEE